MEPNAPAPADLPRDYLQALTIVRSWKTFFLALALLAVVSHAGAWVGVRHVGLLDGHRPSVLDDVAPAVAATQQARAEFAFELLSVGLPMTEFIGRVAVFLLAITLLIAAALALVGRLPVAGFLNGFFWTLIALGLCLPWERLTPRAARMPGIFTDVAALESIAAAPAAASGAGHALEYLRFLAYPAVAAAILLYANASFRRSFREVQARPGGAIPMRVV